MDFQEVVMYKAPDGTLFNTLQEAATYPLQKAIEIVSQAVTTDTLETAVLNPRIADPALVQAVSLLNTTLLSRRQP